MNEFQFIVKRSIFGLDYTAGELLYIDPRESLTPQKLCYTLEDTARAHGVKVKGHTCVPEGKCEVIVNRSTRFKRDMLLMFNQEDFTLELGGISFSGIRAHGGNRIDNTEGCPLVAYNRLADNLIQGTAEKEITARAKDALAAGMKVTWEWRNAT